MSAEDTETQDDIYKRRLADRLESTSDYLLCYTPQILFFSSYYIAIRGLT